MRLEGPRRHRLRFNYPSQRPYGRFAVISLRPRCVVDLPPGREPRCVVDLPPGHEPRCVVDLSLGHLPIILGPRRGKNGAKMSDLGSSMEPKWVQNRSRTCKNVKNEDGSVQEGGWQAPEAKSARGFSLCEGYMCPNALPMQVSAIASGSKYARVFSKYARRGLRI